MALLPAWWPMVLGVGIVGAFTYWVVDEWADADGAADAVQGAGERADRVTGELVGAFGALVMSLVMIAITIGDQLAEAVGMIGPLLGQAPMLIGQIVIAALGYLSLSGALGLSAAGYGYAVVLVLIVALFLRRMD